MMRPRTNIAVLLVVLLAMTACADEGGGAEPTATSQVDATISTTLASTTVTAPAGSSTTSEPTTTQPATTGTAVPTTPPVSFHGVVWTEFSSDTLTFSSLDSNGAITAVPITKADPGCGLGLSATTEGVELALDFMGMSGEGERFPWGSDSTTIVESQPLEAITELAAGGITISVDDEAIPQRLSITESDGATMTLTGLDDAVPYLQLHGFDGRRLLIRAEPAEPACDRGVVAMIDLSAGTVACVDGRELLAILVGSAAELETLSIPGAIVSDADVCRSNPVSSLTDSP